MAFNTIKLTSKLDTETIFQLFKTHTHPKDASWNIKEFGIKHTAEKTYSCDIVNNTFKLRARKTNQRRQSRPIGYGEISQDKKNTIIHIIVVPHIGSMVTWSIFFLCSLLGLANAFFSEYYFSLIPGILIPMGLCLFYFSSLKYDTKDMHLFVQKILKEKNELNVFTKIKENE